MSKGYTGVHAAVKFKRGVRPKHNVANGILGELQHNNILLRLALLNTHKYNKPPINTILQMEKLPVEAGLAAVVDLHLHLPGHLHDLQICPSNRAGHKM